MSILLPKVTFFFSYSIIFANMKNVLPALCTLWCSERYKETYGDNAALKRIDGENHTIFWKNLAKSGRKGTVIIDSQEIVK